MVIDSLPLFNELDMLKLHLDHYKSLVDATIIIESPFTFSGKPKPMYLLDYKDYFKGYNIIWGKYTPKNEPNVWFREFGQRDKAREVVKWKSDDIILINDVDEFVNLDTLERVIQGIRQLEESASAMCFIMDHYQGTFNCKLEEPWPGTVILPLHSMKYKFSTYRDNRARLPLIQNGGWHLSYFGGVERIQQKIQAYSHLEKNTPEINNADRIAKALAEGTRII